MSEVQKQFNEQQNNIEDAEEDYFDVTRQDNKKESKKKIIDWKNYRKPFNRENPY